MKLKIMALLIAMVTVIALLASCGPKNNGEGEGEENGPNGKYPWNKTDILVQLYENDAAGELSSGLKRYYAGQDTAGTDEVDKLVRERNVKAAEDANVKVNYNYETSFGWGQSKNDIQALAKSGSKTAPDIFANFAYDMTACALNGCFANLYANTSRTATKYGNGANYFTFTKDGYVGTSDKYFDSNAGQGYFYDYMQSLAFVNPNGVYDKMYCLASNYCVDAVRSFLVVPVNVNLLNKVALEASTGDKDGDGDFDIEDFYKDVWDYGFTYNVVATLSSAVYSDTNKTVENADILDTLGFCAGNGSGLTGSGVLYTTSVKIINKVEKTNEETGAKYWTYEYPTTNSDLTALSNALKTLFGGSVGVCTLNSDGAKAANLGDSDLKAIRSRFSEDKVLFGGIIAVGSFEDEIYQKMNEPGKGGFGVVPVPLYKQDEAKTEKYQTLVHNLARIVAISATTTEFEQCSAYLDYQSTNSADILEMYYTENLVAAVEGGMAGTHNVEMLTYIRNHVRDCFDKTYEDVISAYQESKVADAMSRRWHSILYLNGYQVDNMDVRYADEYPGKQELLETVLDEWSRLP